MAQFWVEINIRTVERDEPLTFADLSRVINSAKGGGVTLCLRSSNGHKDRGGYFFHIQVVAKEDKYRIFDFEKNEVACLNGADLVSFVNHVSGRKFDPSVHKFCQQTVNLRLDQISAGTET